MRISDTGLGLIEQFEGKKLTAYLDSVGIPTIGVGHTGPEVALGQCITDERCWELLRDDVKEAEHFVITNVAVPLTQSQFDALVSFVFNIGGFAFSKSTLLAKLNGKDYEGASKEFPRWNKAGGKELAGLTKRRLAEAELFCS